MWKTAFFKDCLPQISLGPFLNTLSHLIIIIAFNQILQWSPLQDVLRNFRLDIERNLGICETLNILWGVFYWKKGTRYHQWHSFWHSFCLSRNSTVPVLKQYEYCIVLVIALSLVEWMINTKNLEWCFCQVRYFRKAYCTAYLLIYYFFFRCNMKKTELWLVKRIWRRALYRFVSHAIKQNLYWL